MQTYEERSKSQWQTPIEKQILKEPEERITEENSHELQNSIQSQYRKKIGKY